MPIWCQVGGTSWPCLSGDKRHGAWPGNTTRSKSESSTASFTSKGSQGVGDVLRGGMPEDSEGKWWKSGGKNENVQLVVVNYDF